MKKLTGILLFIIPVFSVLAQKQNIPARDYNDRIVEEQIKIGNKMNDFVSAETNEAYDLNYKALLKQVDASIDVLKKMGAWEGDASLQNSAIQLFGFYKNISQNEYKEFLKILKKADEDITDADIKYIENLEVTIGEKEKKFDDDFSYNQIEFAKRWKFELQGAEEEITE